MCIASIISVLVYLPVLPIGIDHQNGVVRNIVERCPGVVSFTMRINAEESPQLAIIIPSAIVLPVQIKGTDLFLAVVAIAMAFVLIFGISRSDQLHAEGVVVVLLDDEFAVLDLEVIEVGVGIALIGKIDDGIAGGHDVLGDIQPVYDVVRVVHVCGHALACQLVAVLIDQQDTEVGVGYFKELHHKRTNTLVRPRAKSSRM